jgi:RNase P/RNase MRP subunit POP5
VSPRKSSTSSGKPSRLRPRYLGIEVAGEHLPPLSPRAWEGLLSERLASAGVPVRRFRLIRSEGRRAVVEVDHLAASRARAAWGLPRTGPNPITLVPRRTWGTLLGAKAWLRRGRATGPPIS